MTKELSSEAAEMLQEARDMDGIEVPRRWWHLAQEIVDAGFGHLSGARGPDEAWKRLRPVEENKG